MSELRRGSSEWQAVAVAGHTFVCHKSCENICWSCGYVTYAVGSADDAILAMALIDGMKSYPECSGYWHGRAKKRIRVPKRLRQRLEELEA